MKIPFLLIPVLTLSLAACDPPADKKRPLADDRNEVSYQDTYYREQKPFYQAAESDADYLIAKRVRESITADNNLSLSAKNIQVSALNGIVTLSGNIDTYQEKDIVAMKASAVSGVNKVVNNMRVNPTPSLNATRRVAGPNAL